MAEPLITFITGGNTGIGFESVKALYASPQAHQILVGSRSLHKAHEAISQLKSEVPESKSTVQPIQIDIEDDKSIENAFKEVESNYGRIDTLINNAGGAFDTILQSKPGPVGIREAWSKDYSINVVSTQVFTTQFAGLLIASEQPRLLFVTSGLSSLTNAHRGDQKNAFNHSPLAGWPKPASYDSTAYRSSKTALNMMALNWVKTLQPDGVKVFIISPGFLATGLGGMGTDLLTKLGAGHPSVGGEFIRDVVEGKRDDDVGQVINKDGVQPW